MDADELSQMIIARRAYGIATDLSYAHRTNTGVGRLFLRRSTGETGETILREVARQLNVEPESVREVVEAALRGEKPTW